jgi:hypothetical protein
VATQLRVPSTLACGHHAWDDAVARSPRGWWWLASSKVLPVSSRGPPGGRRATGAEVGLTEGGGQLRGGGCGSVRRRAAWS